MEVILTNKFVRQSKRIHPSVLKRIAYAIDDLEKGIIAGEPLGGKLEGKFKIRVGNYRILYQSDGNSIFVTDVGHRQNIYE